MKDTVNFRPEWLDALSACSAKVQMDIISAIVRWQSEGIMPDFKGMKMALFLFLKADLEKAQADGQPEAEADTNTTEAKTAATAAARPGPAMPRCPGTNKCRGNITAAIQAPRPRLRDACVKIS